jgi:hypothetical protein
MKDLHPRFRFHTHDWLTRHLLIKHCQAILRSFVRLGDDPDLATYEEYMNKQKRKKQKEAQQTLKKRRIEPPGHLVLPGPKVSLSILCFQQANALESQSLHKPKSAKPQGAAARPSTSTMRQTRNTRAADEVGPPFHMDPFCANILCQDEDMNPELTDVSIPRQLFKGRTKLTEFTALGRRGLGPQAKYVSHY